MLSIVIPTYNRETMLDNVLNKYFEITINAAEKHGFEFEFVVVDDCSSDQTFVRLSRFEKKYDFIKCLRMPKNKGPGITRNAGYDIAVGDWIWFLDDDDLLDANNVNLLFGAIREAPDNIDLIAHSLKNSYKQKNDSAIKKLVQGVMNYQEHQEVFRYIVRNSLLQEKNIRFSPGVHEDIRYLIELLLNSKNIIILPINVVNKQRSFDAITSRMSELRIDGYLNAYIETRELFKKFQSEQDQMLRQFFVQTLGVILFLIVREPEKNKALSYLAYLGWRISGSIFDVSDELNDLQKYGELDSNFKYSTSIYFENLNLDVESLLSLVSQIFSTRLSCKDLDSSLFLGPDEVRACCKRFFVNGIRKGDVVLLKADSLINLDSINEAKENLIRRINSEMAKECEGCPYIERRAVKKTEIDYVSLENFAYCNMRCTYCSPKYYGGTESKYNAADIIAQLSAPGGPLRNNYHVVWGGGEPTLSPHFDPINNSLLSISKSGKIRVLSNSLKFSKSLYSKLSDERFHLVTSIDAGKEETFSRVRGKDGLLDVFENLTRYQKIIRNPRKITIKYILNQENFYSNELESFANLLDGSPLLGSLFQISCDFNIDIPKNEIVCAIYELALRLLNKGANFVFFDDLIRDRVKIDSALAICIQEKMMLRGISCEYLFTPKSHNFLILWGDGMQAQWLMHNTASGQAGKILKTVQDAIAFEHWCQTDLESIMIFPAGVQSLYEIINNIENAGLSSRLARSVIL